MSWRRFCALLAGLSPRSLWNLLLQDDGAVITDPAALDALFLD